MGTHPPRDPGASVQSVPKGRPVTFWLWDLWPSFSVSLWVKCLLPGVALSQVPSLQGLLFWKSIMWTYPYTRALMRLPGGQETSGSSGWAEGGGCLVSRYHTHPTPAWGGSQACFP